MTLVSKFKKLKADGRKVVIVTSYDYWSAKILSNTNVDGILVGDCATMVMHGHPNTLFSSVEMMARHTEAVVKGAPNKFIISAVPFLSLRKDFKTAMDNVETLMKAGAMALKIEWAKGNERLIAHLVDSGIPVVGHIGLTPQHHHQTGGFKVQGKSEEAVRELVNQAKLLQDLGCFCLALEAVPPGAGYEVSRAVDIPVIGIGAGLAVDGQAMVLQDLLGFTTDLKPRFVRQYLDGARLMEEALNTFVREVKDKHFPGVAETYAHPKNFDLV